MDIASKFFFRIDTASVQFVDQRTDLIPLAPTYVTAWQHDSSTLLHRTALALSHSYLPYLYGRM
jgi:hypothetical protein